MKSSTGIASLLLLFAMSAFSVLGVAALTTGFGAAPPGETVTIFNGVPEGNLTKFVAPLVVPSSWRVQGSNGSYAFELPVLVPETGGQPSGSTAAWHAMNQDEVPGLEVCCESAPGVCARRKMGDGGAIIEDWNPGAGDSLQMSLQVTTSPDPATQKDMVSATVLGSRPQPPAGAAPIACQLEMRGTVIGKGVAYLRQQPRQTASGLTTDLIEGSFELAVRTK